MKKLLAIIFQRQHIRGLVLVAVFAAAMSMLGLIPPLLQGTLIQTAISQVPDERAPERPADAPSQAHPSGGQDTRGHKSSKKAAGSRAIALVRGLVQGYRPMTQVLLLSAIYLAVVQFARLLSALASVVSIKVRNGIVFELQRKLFHRLQRRSPDYFVERQGGEILQRVLGDPGHIVGLLEAFTWTLPHACLQVVCYGAFVFSQNWLLGAVALIGLPAQFYLNRRFARRIRPLRREKEEAENRLYDRVYETIGTMDEVRSQCGFHQHDLELGEHLRRKQEIQLRSLRVQRWLTQGTTFVTNFGFIALLLTGVSLALPEANWSHRLYGLAPWASGEPPVLQVGMLLAILQYCRSLKGALTSLFGLPRTWALGRVYVDYATDFLGCPLHIEPGGKKVGLDRASLALQGVTVQTQSGEHIISDVDATVAPADSVAFVGPSGSGKSTTVKLFNRSAVPSRGQVLLGGHPATECDFEVLAAEIGLVSQTTHIFANTVLYNLVYALLKPCERPVVVDGLRVDTSRLDGIGTADSLLDEVLRVAIAVGLEEDLITWGLQMAAGTPLPPRERVPARRRAGEGGAPPGANPPLAPPLEGGGLPPALAAGIAALRDDVRQAAAAEGAPLTFFDADGYQDGLCVAENLFPGLIDWDALEPDSLAERELMAFCRERGLERPLLALAARVLRCRRAITLSKRRRLRVALAIREGEAAIAARCDGLVPPDATAALATLSRSVKADLLRLAWRHVESREPLLDEELRGRILEARRTGTADLGHLDDYLVRFDRTQVIPGLSLRENLAYGRYDPTKFGARNQVDRIVAEALERRGLLGAVARTGLRFHVGAQGSKLSGGQRQKICIARTLLKRPKVLILDEATSSLDNKSQARVGQLLSKEFADCTVVAVAHRLESIRDFQTIYVMEAGRIVESGTYDELVARGGPFSQLVAPPMPPTAE